MGVEFKIELLQRDGDLSIQKQTYAFFLALCSDKLKK